MRKEATAKAATIEEAVRKAAEELGAIPEDCQVEVLETPRKSLFGKLKEAVVRVTCEVPETVSEAPAKEEAPAAAPVPEQTEEAGHAAVPSQKAALKLETAQEYLLSIFGAMGLKTGPDGIRIRVDCHEDGATLTLDGEGIAVLIGHHGETLDALQYLVALACNRVGGEYYRISLDCGNYREKREETLRGLAARIAAKVKKTGRSQLLEPMNPYERRIIHSVVSEIEGVTSKSKGEEPNRRVVIMSDNPARQDDREFGRDSRRGERRGGGGRRRNDSSYRPKRAPERELTMEEILKSDFRQKEEEAELYSKIEL